MDDALLYVRIEIDKLTFRQVLETTTLPYTYDEPTLRVIYAQLLERRQNRAQQLTDRHRQRRMQER